MCVPNGSWRWLHERACYLALVVHGDHRVLVRRVHRVAGRSSGGALLMSGSIADQVTSIVQSLSSLGDDLERLQVAFLRTLPPVDIEDAVEDWLYTRRRETDAQRDFMRGLVKAQTYLSNPYARLER